MCPPQTPASTSSGSSTGPPARAFMRRLVQGYREHRGRGQLLAGVRPQRGRPAGDHVVDDQVRARAARSAASSTSRAAPDHDGRAVVHRVVERRAAGDQPVELGDGHADGGVGGRAQPAGRDRAVHVERAVLVRPVEVDGERGRQHQRVALPIPGDGRRRGARPARRRAARAARSRSSTIRLRPRPTVVRAVGRAAESSVTGLACREKWPARTGQSDGSSNRTIP